MGERAAAGGGKWVDVAPERLPRWLENFGTRHSAYREEGLTLIGTDGATATLHAPPGAGPVTTVAELIGEACAPRRLGLLLARKGAVAVGIADGPKLIASKVDTHYVQGRTAAGGWSQQRFARRLLGWQRTRAHHQRQVDIRIGAGVPAQATRPLQRNPLDGGMHDEVGAQ